VHFEITIIEKNMPTGNAEPSIIADAKPIIEDCIICLYIVYGKKKRFVTETNGLGLKNCIYDLGLKWYILITNYIGCFLM
jgi:hypothetical protein